MIFTWLTHPLLDFFFWMCAITCGDLTRVSGEFSKLFSFPYSIFESQDFAVVPLISLIYQTLAPSHWPGLGLRCLDKYMCRGIFDFVPVSVAKFAVRQGAEVQRKAAGATLNLRHRLSPGVCRPQRRIWAYTLVGVVPGQRTSLKPSDFLFFLALFFSVFFFPLCFGQGRGGGKKGEWKGL